MSPCLGHIISSSLKLCLCTGSIDYPPATNIPNLEGFDYFLGYNSQENAHNYYPNSLMHNKVSLSQHTHTHTSSLALMASSVSH